MPIYDFYCEACGPFAAMRSIAERDRPAHCPACSASAARMVSAPALSLMSGTRRNAYATNERAAHAPRHSSEMSTRHRPGCSCCSGAKLSLAGASGGTQPNGLKSPASGRRPWMISH
jgi:putative FmdB family regulatory protein